ncbi:BCCT family transporter, partial [Burkholderia mallei]
VGLFIARISRGRTIREFVFGILTIPTIFSILWFTVFGNGAIWLDTHVAGGVLSALTGSPDVLLFRFLDYLP